jgi:iron-sulfur cluster assembly accessory protein
MSVETQFPIRLTERAIDRIKQVLARQGKQDAYLRIGVRAGGCSGYEHVMLPVDAPRPNDLVAEFDGVRIVVDPKSTDMQALCKARSRVQSRQEVVERLQAALPTLRKRRLALYGFFAEERPHTRSDVDLVVELERLL